jgi:hypothetical protein
MTTTTTEAPAKPASLVEVAAGLDEHAQAILTVQQEDDQDEAETRERIRQYEREHLAALAERSRDRQSRIKERSRAAEGLIAHQQRLMVPFAGIFARPATKPARGGTRAKGEKPDYAARIATRRLNAAKRKFGEDNDLVVPPPGSNDFSDELNAAFARDGGYQG